MNYQSILNKYSNILKNNQIKSYKLDCELLLSHALKIHRENLMINLNKNISKDQFHEFKSLLKKRYNKHPIAYIIKNKEFWKSNFYVNDSVLIPRPETELVIEQVLNSHQKNKFNKILDIGTGSGCIIISLLKELKHAKGTGVDISKNAIKVAKINAKMQQLSNRIKFEHSDVDKFLSNKYDLIVSNPPYIKKNEIKSLQEDIKNYEPLIALDGGINGFSGIKKVIYNANRLLKKNGVFILEIAHNQSNEVRSILMSKNFYVIKTSKDLSGKNRCIVSLKIK